MIRLDDTIVAPSTPPGVSAIAVIRLSGSRSIQICDSLFSGKDLTKVSGYTLHYGNMVENGKIIDEVMISVFKSPHSYTKEDSVEISTHGSPFIVESLVKALVRAGARNAEPGEFTRRAFLNGRFDLAQAEAVADLIHSDSRYSHDAAIHQMRGGFSEKISKLREKLVHFASMVELELDFGEEDVEFANRSDLKKLVEELLQVIDPLISSFDMGQVIKNGVPVVIAGKPNAGKSTLLNSLLSEEKAIVSEIAGTTRDIIEDSIQIEGIHFRFIDTAGLRDTVDKIEAIGVERAYAQMKKASLILYLFDVTVESPDEMADRQKELNNLGIPYLMIANKTDQSDSITLKNFDHLSPFPLVAKDENSVGLLREALVEKVKIREIDMQDTIVTNSRHYSSLLQTRESLDRVIQGINMALTGDLLAEDIRMALNSLGEITGEVTNDEVLGNIFSKFCIGK